MNNPKTQPWVEQLKKEAEQQSPPFSADLHGRVMRRVRETQLTAAPSSPLMDRWKLAVVGLAAAAAVVIVIAWLRPTANLHPQPIVRNDLGGVDRLILSAGHPIRWSLDQPTTSGSLAYLDQDAKTFGRYVMRQLDGLSEPKKVN